MSHIKEFKFKDKFYPVGTYFIFNGIAEDDESGEKVQLKYKEVRYDERCIVMSHKHVITPGVGHRVIDGLIYIYFTYNNKRYKVNEKYLDQCVVSIRDKTKDLIQPTREEVISQLKNGDDNIAPTYRAPIEKQKTETDWDDFMVAKTLFYIMIMCFGVIFHERIAIWIIATVWWAMQIANSQINVDK